jgi:hypothetical protein
VLELIERVASLATQCRIRTDHGFDGIGQPLERFVVIQPVNPPPPTESRWCAVWLTFETPPEKQHHAGEILPADLHRCVRFRDPCRFSSSDSETASMAGPFGCVLPISGQ